MQADWLQEVAKASVDERIPELSLKLDQLLRLMEEQLHVQKVSLLEQPGHVLRFQAGLTAIALSLPEAQNDPLQRMVLKSRNFYEARLLLTLRDLGLVQPGATVCDIGANIGNHAVYFGKVMQAGRILAFEPQPHCYQTLCRNLDLNGLTEALAYNVMVGPHSGRGQLAKSNTRNPGAVSFQVAAAGDVPMMALDDLIEDEAMQGLSFVKIDVGGMQLDVLRGAERLLERLRPALWVTMAAGDPKGAQTISLLVEQGYSAIRIGPNDMVFRPS